MKYCQRQFHALSHLQMTGRTIIEVKVMRRKVRYKCKQLRSIRIRVIKLVVGLPVAHS